VAAAVLALLYREMKVRARKGENKTAVVSTTEATKDTPASSSNSKTMMSSSPPLKASKTSSSKAQSEVQQAEGATNTDSVSRNKELKLCLEKETKEKQSLSEQNNFLKSALEERKATVEMFTTELQVRC
jgi:hypothetical protein